MKKYILYAVVTILIVIQFFRPEKNVYTGAITNHIRSKYPYPTNVEGILNKACNDCHSNNTNYPWYFRIQPVAWWLDSHVREGKSELNFGEFLTYSPKKARHKMEGVVDEVKEGKMPLNSYTWTHKDARLTQEERIVITDWATGIMNQIVKENNLPAEEPREPGKGDD